MNIKDISKSGPMWHTKYAAAISKKNGIRIEFFGRGVKAISSLGVRSPRLEG